MRIGNSTAQARATQGLAQAAQAIASKQKADPGPKAGAQAAPAATAEISDKGKAAAAKAATEAQVEKATRGAAARNGPTSMDNAQKAAGLLRSRLADATA